MKKISSIILSLLVMFGLQLTSVHAAVDLTKEGTYTVDVDLWNESRDQASMAAGAVEKQAKIVVKDGKATMYLSTKEMKMGTISAWLQELYIGDSSSDYHSHSATVETRDEQGNPTLWSFELPHQNEYINVMMNPHVAMMGNMDLGARIKIFYDTLTYVEEEKEPEQPQEPQTPVQPSNPKGELTEGTQTDTSKTQETKAIQPVNQTSKAVKTGDQQSIGLFIGLMFSSLFVGLTLKRKLLK